MKKLIIMIFMLLGIVVMAEKLSTDGKDHLKELLGKWGEPNPFYLILKDKKLYYVDEESVSNPVTKVNNYTFMIHRVESGNKSCFAYDVKKKTFTFLKCGTDEVNSFVPRKHNTFGG